MKLAVTMEHQFFKDTGLVALANVVVDDTFALRGVRLIQSENGLFVGMPRRLLHSEFVDQFHPITRKSRAQLTDTMIAAYHNAQLRGPATLESGESEGLRLHTEIKQQFYGKKSLIALANVSLDDAFLIRGLQIRNGQKGLYVSMPQRITPEGEYKSVCAPITTEETNRITQAVLNEFQQVRQLAATQPRPEPQMSM